MLEEFNAVSPVAQNGRVNTVLEQPEPVFRRGWIQLLSGAMLISGKGFRVDSPNRKPKKGVSRWHGERRADKVGTTKLSRRLLKVAVQA